MEIIAFLEKYIIIIINKFMRKYMSKRILLFILTNLAVMVTLGIVASIFGVTGYLGQNGINYTKLFGFSLIFGFGGAFISLLMSKWIAKFSMGVKLIDPSNPLSQDEKWLINVIQNQSNKLNITMPEVGVYNSPEMNAFATGPTRNNALVALSTGILERMNRDEIEAVIGHEMSHVANGDMVTTTLLQGVLNTFVIFFSRVISFIIDTALRGNRSDGGTSFVYIICTIIFDILFGALSSLILAYHSRNREFKADFGGATLGTKDGMIKALAKLGGETYNQPKAGIQALCISSKSSFIQLFSTHPPIEDRINALKNIR